MPVDDIRIVLFSVAFGCLIGWGLGRRSDQRRASLAATSLTALAGAICWAVAVESGALDGTLAVAAVSLVFGSGAAAAVVVTTGRR